MERLFSWSHLLSQLASLICTFIVITVFLCSLAVCLRLAWLSHGRILRAFAGIALAAGLMLLSPVIYRRPRQHMGVVLATNTYMAALTMLDWCLLQPSAAAPSVTQVLMSFIDQPMSGIITAYNSRTRTVGDAPNDNRSHKKSFASKQQQLSQLSRWQLLGQNVMSMVRIAVVMDVASAVLDCCLCNGDLSSWHASSWYAATAVRTPSIAAVIAEAAGLTGTFMSLVPPSVVAAFVRFCTVVFASLLLGMQLEFTYMTGRLVLIVCGYPDVGPVHMFNKPWLASSMSDLWSNRWHQVLRYYFTGLGYSAADRMVTTVFGQLQQAVVQRTPAPPKQNSSSLSAANQCRADGSSSSSSNSSKHPSMQASTTRLAEKPCQDAATHTGQQQQQQQQCLSTPDKIQQQVKRTVRTLVVFAMSGLVHEYIVWAAFGVITGQQMTFFLLHGSAVVLEGLGSQLLCYFGQSNNVVPHWFCRVWVYGFAVWTAPLFVDVYLQHNHYQNYVPPFIVPVTKTVLVSFESCSCSLT